MYSPVYLVVQGYFKTKSMENYNNTINVDLKPLEVVSLRQPLELLRESIIIGAEAEGRQLYGIEDLQIRTLDKMLTQMDMQVHKINTSEVQQELRDYDKQYRYEQEAENHNNLLDLLDIDNQERLN